MIIINNNCDCQSNGVNCSGEHSEVRVLATSPDSNAIVCEKHYNDLVWWMKRQDVNTGIYIPTWKDALVYSGE